MKRILLVVVVLLSCAGGVFAGLPRGWTDDLDAAKKSAAETGKNILVVFSGSDWCGWCVKFDKDTLSKPEFVRQASKKYELVMIDSPKDKSILSAKAKTQNPKLVKQYDVHGYPSYVLTDAEGTVIGRSCARDPPDLVVVFVVLRKFPFALQKGASAGQGARHDPPLCGGARREEIGNRRRSPSAGTVCGRAEWHGASAA